MTTSKVRDDDERGDVTAWWAFADSSRMKLYAAWLNRTLVTREQYVVWTERHRRAREAMMKCPLRRIVRRFTTPLSVVVGRVAPSTDCTRVNRIYAAVDHTDPAYKRKKLGRPANIGLTFYRERRMAERSRRYKRKRSTRTRKLPGDRITATRHGLSVTRKTLRKIEKANRRAAAKKKKKDAAAT